MEVESDVVDSYVSYFFSKIVGFESDDLKYRPIGNSGHEFISIAMDKVDRLTRKAGKLRNRVWSNCYFIFHRGDINPSKKIKTEFAKIKKQYPFLFIRSYVYLIFVDISKGGQNNIFSDLGDNIQTKDYKVWVFNSKYEIRENKRRRNIFGISLGDNEVIDDYVYLANPDSEIVRMESTNSDAIDCVRAFTGDLELLEQTQNMLEKLNVDFENNLNARVIVEGPARSGKTIIAATLLGQHNDSKLLIMNYFFYQAIVDGFYALSGWDAAQIEELVKNDELDMWVAIKKNMPKILPKISKNLQFAIGEVDRPKKGSMTKKWLMDNIHDLTTGFDSLVFEKNNMYIMKSLLSLNSRLNNTDDNNPFFNIDKNNLKKLKRKIDVILSEKLERLQCSVVTAIENIISNSKQKIFHHNINRSISPKVENGCWIERDNPTISKMWSENYHPKLIICDEVQRLGIIPPIGRYDQFNEIQELLNHSEQSFFTGDDFQMLNSKYDLGIEKVSDEVRKKGQSLIQYKIPESVGVPAEVGVLMKYLTNPKSVTIDEVVRCWGDERDFTVIFIDNNSDSLVRLYDEDLSHKKHFASPMDSNWMDFNDEIKIFTCLRDKPIIPLSKHEKEDFAYKFPYFCNEEIMPRYLLSAYELISRELESLYIHIPRFSKINNENIDWFCKHLYVLFTRPTSSLVVNFDVKEDFDIMYERVRMIKERGAKFTVNFQ